MALVSNPMCSVAELTRFMSAGYVTAAADNDGDDVADTDVVEDAINWATHEIRNYAAQYADSALPSNGLANRWGVLLAACFLVENRGNGIPNSWSAERDRVWVMLERLLSGDLTLKGVALSQDFRPSMSNLAINRLYRRSKVRVTTANSSDSPTKLSQDVASDYPTTLN